MTALDRDAIYEKISGYIQEQFLGESGVSELEPDTPLLEWGVLTSMNTSLLLTYIRKELGVTVPPTHITGKHFKTLTTITDMVHELSLQPA
ncbi:phosphopantetheine-binding protein [Streptomyces sp. TRM 70351]|uniref:phosphopantetheine-binding protein n=1 Tax=Streptomyces sp. TRM 70351 TaxID=3116552 RepID=UPI002E7ADD1C|nr:phosphopantetheine-binding protein [Streptomyces sp. TRM 70351]MEE1931089.1 phosphopantetheine-binding protein [Streptomyces sp. TRM 70351]